MSEDWKESLPEDIRNNPSLKDVADVNSLANQFINAQSLLGNSIRVPGPDAGAEAMSEFHGKLMDKVPGLIPTPDPENAEAMAALFKKMGRPDDPAGYEHPEGIDPSKMGDFAKVAFESGMTKAQYTKILEAVSGFATTKKEEATQAQLDGIRALKQEWGITYEDNLQFINQVMKGTQAPKEWMAMAAEGKLPADALRWFKEIGDRLGKEGINFQKDETTTRLAPAEAKARLDEIMSDRDGPYWDASHPQHKDYIQRVVDLQRAAMAGG